MGSLQASPVSSTTPTRRRRSGPPPGLRNLGNTCYLNSVLQCLASTPPLVVFCLSARHSSICKSVVANREKECPFCLLERQIARLCSPREAVSVDEPQKILTCLSLFVKQFRVGQQEDAHEFLRFVIDACHTTCLKLREFVNERSGEAKENVTSFAVGQNPYLVMKEIFGGALLSQVKCMGCKGESNKTDEIMDLSLDLQGCNSIDEALKRFFQPEVLDGGNKYNCERCKKHCVAKKQMFILTSPNVLVIHLKRFEGIFGAKINRNIDFDEGLVLSQFMCNGSQDPLPVYNLFGSIVHAGASPESGHYYAYIMDDFGRWYCCNDSHVTLSSSQDVLSEKVYMLFYTRSSKSKNSNKNGTLSRAAKFPDTNGNGVCQNLKSDEVVTTPSIKRNGYVSCTKASMVVKNRNIPVTTNHGVNGLVIRPASTDSKNIREARDSGILRVNKKINHGDNTTLQINPSPKDVIMDCTAEAPREQFSSSSSNGRSIDASISRVKTNGNGCHNKLPECEVNEGTKTAACIGKACNGRPFMGSNDSEGYRKPILHPGRAESSSEIAHDPPTITSSHCPDEFEGFEQKIMEEASSLLWSCGWAKDVENSVHSKKRLCMKTTETCPDLAFMRKLISDYKETFRKQIPESIKENLIDRLRPYIEAKASLHY